MNNVASALARGRSCAKRQTLSSPLFSDNPSESTKKRPAFLKARIAEEEYKQPENFLGQDLYSDVSGLKQLSLKGFEDFMEGDSLPSRELW